jgi:uncharacterized membrane protein YkgB
MYNIHVCININIYIYICRSKAGMRGGMMMMVCMMMTVATISEMLERGRQEEQRRWGTRGAMPGIPLM